MGSPLTVVFFTTEGGRAPAEETIRKLTKRDPKDGLLIDAQIAKLRTSGPKLRFPHVEKIQRDIWQVRCRGQRGLYRLLYFYYGLEQTYVIVHAILKKKGRTPQSAKATAKKRKWNFLSRK